MMHVPSVDWLNLISHIWWQWISRSTIESTVLAALIFGLWMAIRKRVQPAVGYWLVMLIPAKLAIPLSIAVPMSIAQWSPSNWILAEDPSADQVSTHNVPLSRARLNAQPKEFRIPHTKLATDFDSSGQAEVAAAPLVRPDPPRPRMSRSSWLMLAWLAIVVLLLGRLIVKHWRFTSQFRRDLRPAQVESCEIEALQRIAGLRSHVGISESDAVSAPAVCRVRRPIVLLPPAFPQALLREQVRWTLLHEFAHIRRQDLLVSTLQRFVNIVHWFNPVIWLANQWLHRQREYICDDMAEGWAKQLDAKLEPTAASEALLQTLRFAQLSGVRSEALSVLGLGWIPAHRARIVRLLDERRKKAKGIRRSVSVALGLLALVTIPQLRATPDGMGDSGQPTGESIDVTVVDPRGKPVAQCAVRFQITPAPTSFEVRQGSLVDRRDHRIFKVTTDDNGRVVCAFPLSQTRFQLFVEFDGYGPYFAEWDTPRTGEPVPETFTIELDDAWTVGGVLINEEGQPIANAEVHPSLEFKKRVPGQLGIGTRVRTDEMGRWQFRQVPLSETDVTVEVAHQDYQPFCISLARDTFGLSTAAIPTATIVATRGLSVSGTVTDPSGKPIAGAVIRTRVLNDVRQTTTDVMGYYRLSGLGPDTNRFVVSAPSFALDMKDVRVDEDTEPVNFELQPGGQLKVRVLDGQGRGIPGARIFFQRWRGEQVQYFEFDHIKSTTDNDGLWSWNEAPLDTLHADICPPDGMQLVTQALLARDNEYVFRPPTQLVVTGSVIDAKTKHPIPEFRAVIGIQDNADGTITWLVDKPFFAKDGRYHMPHLNRAHFAHWVRIEADGYLPKVSREIQFHEGVAEVNFDLDRGQNVVQVVVDRAGNPVADAEVMLGVAGSQISITNGRIDDRSTFYSLKVQTDSAGRFQIPPQVGTFYLVVLHEKGFASVTAHPAEFPEPIELEPWAVLKGRYLIGTEPMVNQGVTATIGRMESYGEFVPKIFTRYTATTGRDGGFTFDRIPAGIVRVRREIIHLVGQGATEVASTPVTAVITVAGETTDMRLGGSGVAVAGQLIAPAGWPEVDWRQASVSMEEFVADVPPLPVPEEIKNDNEQRNAWMEEWTKTAAGQAWSTAVEHLREIDQRKAMFYATVSDGGFFRIDDVPIGNYRLRAFLEQKNARASISNYRVEMREGSGNRDLGPLQLQ